MKKKLSLFLICVLVLCTTGCTAERSAKTTVDTAMGTIVSVTIYGDEEAANKTAQVVSLVRDLENEISVKRTDTTLSKVNEACNREGQAAISKELGELIRRCNEIYVDSEGAFDITVGTLTELWNIDAWAAGENREDYSIPSDDRILKAKACVGEEKLALSTGKNGTLTLSMPKGMLLNLGAAGKGLALDRAFTYIEQQQDIEYAVASVGGSVLTYGQKPDKEPFRVAIADPFSPDNAIGILTLTGNSFLSTSGDYERYVFVDGVRFHHILDPKTGYPAQSDLRSVSILARDGFLSDALSTACFVLGSEKGLELAQKYNAEALMVTKDREIRMTPGMEKMFTALP